MKKIALLIIAVLTINFGFLLATAHFDSFTAHAATTLKESTFNVRDLLKLNGNNGDDQPQNYFKDDTNPIVSLMITILNFAIRIIGSIAVIILIIGGFMFMFSQGNQTQVDAAKDVIKYAAIGLAVTFLSYIIVIFVQSLFITSETTQLPNQPAPAAPAGQQ